MFRFTIRDVLWLTVVVALGVGWWRERGRITALLDAGQSEIRVKCSPQTIGVVMEAITDHLEEHHLRLSHDNRGWSVEMREE